MCFVDCLLQKFCEVLGFPPTLSFLFKRLRAFRRARLKDNTFLLEYGISSSQHRVSYCHVVACCVFVL